MNLRAELHRVCFRRLLGSGSTGNKELDRVQSEIGAAIEGMAESLARRTLVDGELVEDVELQSSPTDTVVFHTLGRSALNVTATRLSEAHSAAQVFISPTSNPNPEDEVLLRYTGPAGVLANVWVF